MLRTFALNVFFDFNAIWNRPISCKIRLSSTSKSKSCRETPHFKAKFRKSRGRYQPKSNFHPISIQKNQKNARSGRPKNRFYKRPRDFHRFWPKKCHFWLFFKKPSFPSGSDGRAKSHFLIKIDAKKSSKSKKRSKKGSKKCLFCHFFRKNVQKSKKGQKKVQLLIRSWTTRTSKNAIFYVRFLNF